MKHLFILAQMFILSFVEGALLLSACAQNKTMSMNEKSITMTQAPLAPEALAEEWDKTFSRYFGEHAYDYMMTGKAEGYDAVRKHNPAPENKELLIIPGASHCDLYDGGKDKVIPWDKLEVFFAHNL